MAEENCICSNPGCTKPGTKQCGACKSTPYCGSICQTADWTHHKEECPGHLFKLGMKNVEKAKDFHHDDNWVQVLKYSDLALKQLKKLTKNPPLEGISDALSMKSDACCFMNRTKESLEYSTERYNLWAMARGPAHPGNICLPLCQLFHVHSIPLRLILPSIPMHHHNHHYLYKIPMYCSSDTVDAAFQLIQSLMHCKDYAQAEKCAYNLWDILNTNNHVDNNIPADKYQEYLARGAMEYARAILAFAEVDGYPPSEKQKAGEDAIVLSRRSLAIRVEQDANGTVEMAASMLTLNPYPSIAIFQ